MGVSTKMSHEVSRERSRNYMRQIKGSVVFMGLAVATSFFAIPIMIHYLGQEQFGVWSTLLSIMSWIVFFDLGLGNGLRNKLAESVAKNEFYEASRFVSSAYSLIGLISATLFALLVIATFVIPWQSVFNTHSIAEPTLRYTVLLAAFFVFINFWISLINQVLNAVQKTSVVVFGQFVTNALSLIFIIILKLTTVSSLMLLALVYGISLVASNLLLSVWFYRQNRELIPGFSLDKQHIRPLVSVGIQFFIIQLAVLFIFTTDKILITQLFGPKYVTQYDVVYKLFSIITIIHALITAPLWSSYTDAYHRGDIIWIKGILRKQLLIVAIIVLVVIILSLIARPVIVMWIGRDIEVSIPLVVSMGVFVIVSTWNNVFANLVNGIGMIFPQLITSIIAMVINVPLSIILVKHYRFGINGIVFATCLSLAIFAIVGPIQVHLLLKKESLLQ